MSPSFWRRTGRAVASLDQHTAYRQEVSPEMPLGRIVEAYGLQDGDIVTLGPYTYNLYNTLTIPEYVTIVGIPHKTKIVLNDASGPAFKMSAYSTVRDCVFELTGSAYTRDQDTDNNAAVIVSGRWARIEGCYFPDAGNRSILVSASFGLVYNNVVFPDTSGSNSSIYLKDGVHGCVVTGNLCHNTGRISWDGTQSNAVEANYAIEEIR